MRRSLIVWGALLLLTGTLIPLLIALRLPAAFMVGPLVAAASVSVSGARIRVPETLFALAQGLIGCMIARGLQAPMLRELAHDSPLFLGGVVSVLIVSCSLSLLLMRWRVLPGTTAIWGSFPGAAMVMTLMAESYGEDVRLVAFMQYLRVVCVAVAASVVARFVTGSAAHEALDLLPAVHWAAFGATALVAMLGAALGQRIKLPAGALLVPLLVATLLQDLGWLVIELPPLVLALGYVLVGWNIGARFDRATLAHVRRALPRVLLATLALIGLCALLGLGLARAAHVDTLTAFLATSPGGADSVAIIATGSHVNVPFVIAMQTSRFVLLLIAGPALARCLAAHTSARGNA